MKALKRVDTLLEPALHVVPLGRADDTRDQVERKDALRALLVAIYVEGDAELQQEAFGGVLISQELSGRERFDGLLHQRRVRAHATVGVEHLVVEAFGLVGGELHSAPRRKCQPFMLPQSGGKEQREKIDASDMDCRCAARYRGWTWQ